MSKYLTGGCIHSLSHPWSSLRAAWLGTGRCQGVSNNPAGLKPPLGFSILLPPAGLDPKLWVCSTGTFPLLCGLCPELGQDPPAELQGCPWALLPLDKVKDHVLPWPLSKTHPTNPQQLHPFAFIPCSVTAPGIVWLHRGAAGSFQPPLTHFQDDQTPSSSLFLGHTQALPPHHRNKPFSHSVPQQKGSVLMLLPKHSLSSRKIPRKVVPAGQGTACQHPWGPAT